MGNKTTRRRWEKNTTRWIETERQEKEMHVFLVFSVESESLEKRTHTHTHIFTVSGEIISQSYINMLRGVLCLFHIVVEMNVMGKQK